VLQLQLALLPEGITAITAEVGCECRDGVVTYFYGHLPLFRHAANDRASFRIFTSQMIVNGTVREADIVRTFGVPRITVRRSTQKLRQEGIGSFFVDRRRGSARVVKGAVREQAQQLLEQGIGVPEIAQRLQVKANTLNVAIRQGRLGKPERPAGAGPAPASTKSERSEADSAAPMGYATTRSLERVAAAMGMLEAAPIEFAAAQDVPEGGVLLALPALLATGLLRHTQDLYTLPPGFYGITSIFLLLALRALARIRSVEQLRYAAPGEWGLLIGLDRIPEVRTLRAKLQLLCQQSGGALEWNMRLAREWIAAQQESELVFYADAHVRVYHGDLTPLPRHYVARQRLCLRATTDYWINAMDGQPFLFINKAVDPGLLATLRQDLVPFLETHVPMTGDRQQRLNADPFQHRFTIVFDREAYSPAFFREMRTQRIAILSYHKFPGEPWPEQEFSEQTVSLAGGEAVTMKLAERGTMLSGQLWLREVRKLSESGHQVSILSTNYQADSTVLAASMFARWSQENFYKYMREHYNLDRLVEYGTEPLPESVEVVNPAWRELDQQIRRKGGQLQRQQALFAQLSLQEPLSDAAVRRYERKKGQLRETIEGLSQEIAALKQRRQETPHHLKVKELPETERFSRLATERKHFVDTIKLISYRAEASMASLLREHLARHEDAHALLRQIYTNEVDLVPDLEAKTLTVRLHHLTQAAHDEAARHLCEELNTTETIFPGTELRLVYQVGSNHIPRDQEV
jgi:transposase-like protein